MLSINIIIAHFSTCQKDCLSVKVGLLLLNPEVIAGPSAAGPFGPFENAVAPSGFAYCLVVAVHHRAVACHPCLLACFGSSFPCLLACCSCHLVGYPGAVGSSVEPSFEAASETGPLGRFVGAVVEHLGYADPDQREEMVAASLFEEGPDLMGCRAD